jgi:hypothetical protein
MTRSNDCFDDLRHSRIDPFNHRGRKMQFPSLTETMPQGRSYNGYHPVGRNV